MSTDLAIFVVETARSAVRTLPGVLTLRFLPFVGFLLISRKTSWSVRVAVSAVYAAIAFAAVGTKSTPFHWLLLTYAYFVGAAWAVFQLSTPSRTRLSWFVIVLSLFWICPVVAVRPIPTAFLVIGWELVFAAYSYHADTARLPNRSFGDFTFFLLVNPALVYRNRGAEIGAPSFRPAGAARVAIGVGAVFFSFAVANVATAMVGAWVVPLEHHRSRAAVTMYAGFTRLIQEYAAHSGVASLQIGALLILGYRIPERYRYPLFARSPAEFWRRWNTYIGDWARVYLYTPIVLRWMRSRRERRTSAARASNERMFVAAMVIATFACIGLLHDVFVMSREHRWSFDASAWFVAIGCVVVLWEAIAIRSGLRANARFGRAVERLVFLGTACCAAAKLW
jgi:hypothetical protein